MKLVEQLVLIFTAEETKLCELSKPQSSGVEELREALRTLFLLSSS